MMSILKKILKKNEETPVSEEQPVPDKIKQEEIQKEEPAPAVQDKKDRKIYTEKGVFSDAIIDYMIKYLTDFNDANLRKELGNDTEKIMKLVKENIHVG